MKLIFCRLVLFAGLIFGVQPAFADFSGAYAIGNWTDASQAFGCGAASVNTGAAPVSVSLQTNAGCGAIAALYQYAALPATGAISFSFNYTVGSFAGPVASYSVAGGPGVNFPAANTGTVTVPVTAGQSFQISLQQTGAVVGAMTISNFVFTPPASVSVPTLSEYGILALASLMAMVGLWYRRRLD